MNKEFIKSAINDAVDNGVVSGISAAIINKEGTEFYFKGKMGQVDPYDKIDLSAGMQYDMASCTKVVATTTRLFQLIEEGKLSLDDKVSDYLERFRFKDVKISNLLLHNSGLPSDMEDKDSLTKDNIVDRIYATDLVNEIGKVTAYSDIGYILLGFIIEKIDGCNLSETYTKHVLEPLKMYDSGYHIKDINMVVPTEISAQRGLIKGVAHDRKGYLLGDDCGSAGLFCTISDVAKFVRSYLYRENALLSEKTVELMLKTNVGDRSYGWEKRYGDDILYHTGFTGTSILMDFKNGEGLVLLTNRVHPSRNNMAYIDWRNDFNLKLLNRK